jgi:hypothetical protein
MTEEYATQKIINKIRPIHSAHALLLLNDDDDAMHAPAEGKPKKTRQK